jgi:hypothetical protein|tara:strand:- start:2237 stop:2446 length:210 start_codon:yes stop_codon:yes gene_type:complete
MKSKPKRRYEVFNTRTGEWESKIMTVDQYEEFASRMNSSFDELEAEYQIVSRIVAQKIGIDSKSKKSMD